MLYILRQAALVIAAENPQPAGLVVVEGEDLQRKARAAGNARINWLVTSNLKS